MKTKVFILILVMFGLTFSSCKKYEDGPFVSLKSKNARLAGEWELISYTNIMISNNDTITSSYDGTTMTNPNNSYLYNLALVFNTDGTLTYKVSYDGEHSEHTSYWSWRNGASRKEQILLYSHEVFNIKKLTNKELILESNTSSISYDDFSTYVDSLNSSQTWTYMKV